MGGRRGGSFGSGGAGELRRRSVERAASTRSSTRRSSSASSRLDGDVRSRRDGLRRRRARRSSPAVHDHNFGQRFEQLFGELVYELTEPTGCFVRTKRELDDHEHERRRRSRPSSPSSRTPTENRVAEPGRLDLRSAHARSRSDARRCARPHRADASNVAHRPDGQRVHHRRAPPIQNRCSTSSRDCRRLARSRSSSAPSPRHREPSRPAQPRGGQRGRRSLRFRRDLALRFPAAVHRHPRVQAARADDPGRPGLGEPLARPRLASRSHPRSTTPLSKPSPSASAGGTRRPVAVNGSALSQLRTNEIALSFHWELREFVLSPSHGASTRPRSKLTPDLGFNFSQTLGTSSPRTRRRLLPKRTTSPSSSRAPFLGGSVFNDLQVRQSQSINFTKREGRFQLSKNT